MSQRRLYVGLDIRDDDTRMAVLAPGQLEPEILTPGDEGETIDTEVAVPGTKDHLDGFLGKIYRQEPIYVDGRESDPVNVLAAFLRRTLAMTQKKYPGESIKRVVVTTEYRDYRFVSTVYRALTKLGIEKDRAMVVDRRQSYIHYVMSQKKELWVNKVGLFDFQRDKLTYYQMETDRFKRPMLVGVKERDYSNYLEMLEGDGNKPEQKASVFEGMVQGAIHGQIITTLYMTGEGFADGFADDVMKKLCIGRHLFKGNNLYVSGACYLAREFGGEKKLDEFMYLDEDSLPADIYFQGYTNAKPQEIMLAKAGTAWYQIDYEVDLIPDGDRELELTVRNVITKEKVAHMIPMEGIPGRTERKARIGVRIRFAGPSRCILTIRDKGFGDFYPCSYRIWEETITL